MSWPESSCVATEGHVTTRAWARTTELFRDGLWRNALGLYVLQITSFLLPLATIFVLARLLGPQNWGSLAFMQAFAGYVVLAVTYGFGYSATREVARHRHDPEKLADLLAGVMGAKVALAVTSLLIVVPLASLVPPIHRSQGLLWPAMLWALSMSFSLNWYYQGLERIAFVARWETAARALSLVGILTLVRSPADTWKVLAIQGCLLSAAVIVELAAAYREVQFRVPSIRLVWRTLQSGSSMFLFSGALSFYTIGNAFILGLFASPTIVGYYVGAEKIGKAAATLLYPITQAIFPRMSHLASTARNEAARLVRTSLFLVGTAGCVMGIIVFLTAPILVRVVLGPGFEASVVVLRILALLPPLVAVSNVLGIQWMLALGLDRFVNTVILSACLLNVSLAVVLVPHYMHVGMAVAVVASESLVALGLYAMLRWQRLDPLAIARAAEQDEPVSASSGAVTG
jgi:polysaccharide transporter, PST family